MDNYDTKIALHSEHEQQPSIFSQIISKKLIFLSTA